MIKLISLFVCFIGIVKITYSQSNGPVVKTPLGSVQGKFLKSYEGSTVAAFEGIPYAKPPVGNLRFKDPEPIEKWSTTLQADKTYVCAQYTFLKPTGDVIGDEDCLYLYVYVPRETITGHEDLDVVVHIHGGAYTVGDPASYAGPEYIMDRDLIFVTMNFRMGILGFLSTQDNNLPGNYGLKDQVMAMKWVKDNIKYFGGNPNSITLTGFASGGSAVHLHYLSPLSRGLFNRGFSQSGSALNPWSLSKNSIQRAKKLGLIFGCKTTSKELVECLKRAPIEFLVGAHANFTALGNTVPPGAFGPVIEIGPKGFLPDHPYKLMLEGKINDCPWVTSNVKDEGISPAGFLLLYDRLQELGNHWNELAPVALLFNDTAFEADKKGISKSIRRYYLKDEGLSEENINRLIKLFTDRYYQLDAIKAAYLQSTVTKSPVYYYFFDYHTNITVPFKANLSVVGHTDDARLLYKFNDNPRVLSDSDQKMKTIFIDFLYRYASTGKPDFKGIEWRPFHTPQLPVSFMHVSSPTQIFENRVLNLEPFNFWHSLPIHENEHLFPYLLNIIQFLHVIY